MTNDRGIKKPQRDRGDSRYKPAPRQKTISKAQSSKSPSEESDGSERIAKRLARAGIASRRDAEMMIAAGRIAVNGKVLDTPAFNVKRVDAITVDGQPLPPIERTRVWLYHKRAGLVTTNRDPEGRPTVFDSLPEGMPRVLSVGRLDINTEGLLLLTNDGGLARVLELPSTGWVRKYRVRAHGKVSQADLDALKDGIAIDGIFYGAVEAILEREQGSNVWLTVALREGKNREVKNILGALGLTVTRLIRVSFGPFQLADLEEGAVRELKGRTLRDQLGDRLIEEANADFDLPILKPFSNAAVSGTEPKASFRPNLPDDGWISSTPQAPRSSKRWKKADFSERGRAQLTTKPGRYGDVQNNFSNKQPKKREEFNQEKPEPRQPRSRSTNVWMAPGARPQTARKKFWQYRDNQDEQRNGQFERESAEHRPNRTSRDEKNSRFQRQEWQPERDDEKPPFKKRPRQNSVETTRQDVHGRNKKPDFGKSTPSYRTKRSSDEANDRQKTRYGAPKRADESRYGFSHHNRAETKQPATGEKRQSRRYEKQSDKPFSGQSDQRRERNFADKSPRSDQFLKRKKSAGQNKERLRPDRRSGRANGGRIADRRR
ncbi:pseudouridine synthase [uncultured Bartonella sp.]|uniref:pseudouridine synthase n=1 Tax=uncultured Bartonella sp. TaxID=104108 RepID=UPI0026255DB7|nr:pseudouridine synthase [uncultured Bartonella sp.]